MRNLHDNIPCGSSGLGDKAQQNRTLRQVYPSLNFRKPSQLTYRMIGMYIAIQGLLWFYLFADRDNKKCASSGERWMQQAVGLTNDGTPVCEPLPGYGRVLGPSFGRGLPLRVLSWWKVDTSRKLSCYCYQSEWDAHRILSVRLNPTFNEQGFRKAPIFRHHLSHSSSDTLLSIFTFLLA